MIPLLEDIIAVVGEKGLQTHVTDEGPNKGRGREERELDMTQRGKGRGEAGAPRKGLDGEPNDASSADILRFPRDYFGRREDLIPFGPAAGERRTGTEDSAAEVPASADTFWGEESARIHDPVHVPPPAPSSRTTRTRLPTATRTRRGLALAAGAAVVLAALLIVMVSPSRMHVRRGRARLGVRHAQIWVAVSRAPSPRRMTKTTHGPKPVRRSAPSVASSTKSVSVSTARTSVSGSGEAVSAPPPAPQPSSSSSSSQTASPSQSSASAASAGSSQPAFGANGALGPGSSPNS